MNDEPTKSSGDDPDPRRGRRVAAGALLTVAVAALVGQHLAWAWRDGMLLVLGVGFVAWAAWGQVRGLLVPGGILMGVGVGVLLRDEYGNAAFLLALAGGFALIPVLSRLIFRRWVCWPFFPAAGVGVAGLLQLAGPDLLQRLREFGPLWPWLLIALALYLWFTKPRARE